MTYTSIRPEGNWIGHPAAPRDAECATPNLVVDTERDTVQYQETLNPAIWNNFQLKPGIREALLKIAHEFINTWKFDIPVQSIILTGSNAGYNWTKYSDFDVHVVVAMGQVPVASAEFVKSLLTAKKTIWNSKHHITVKGYDVELYAQDTTEVLVAAGVYDLVNERWAVMPEPKMPEFSHPSVISKAQFLAQEIDSACLSPNEQELRALMDEIADLRKSGLQTAGEFSIENLAFKVLRNSGHIKKLRDTLGSLVDLELSVEHTVSTFGEFVTEHLTATGRYKKQRNLTRNRWKLHRRSQIALGITGSAKRMKRRGLMSARRAMYKKLLGISPTKKSHLTSTQKLEAERMIKRHAGSYIKNLAPRSIPVAAVRQRKRLTKRYGNLKAYRR
jgi:hypothetical protein